MGGGPSSSVSRELTVDELTLLMMPPYYKSGVVVQETDIILGRVSWQKIADGSSQGFQDMKAIPGFNSPSCLTWFYDSFYNRLFDVNPSARPLFKTDMKSQGRVLMAIISTSLNMLRDTDSFNTMLVNLTHSHSHRGVRGMQYGIAGDVLFWTLNLCLGPIDFDDDTRNAWINIFSSMLSIMVPVAVSDEISEIENANTENPSSPWKRISLATSRTSLTSCPEITS
eukprot:gene13572-28800_t